MVLNRFLVNDLKKEGLWNKEVSDQLKYFDGELSDIPGIPDWIKKKYLTAFDVSYEFVIAAAARRQKWIDQSQSVNLFLGQPDLKALSHMYRAAWRQGLKTTYYLRTLGASNIEKATVDLKQGKPLGEVSDEPSAKKEYTEAEKKAAQRKVFTGTADRKLRDDIGYLRGEGQGGARTKLVRMDAALTRLERYAEEGGSDAADKLADFGCVGAAAALLEPHPPSCMMWALRRAPRMAVPQPRTDLRRGDDHDDLIG